MPADFKADRRTLAETAAEWYFRFDARDLNATERKELLRWLKTASHCDEFIQIAKIVALVRNRNLSDCYNPRGAVRSANRQQGWRGRIAAVVAIALVLFGSVQISERATSASPSIIVTRSVQPDADWIGTSFVISQGKSPSGIIVASNAETFADVMQAIERNPRVIHQLSWRQWEEIVAAGWHCFGYRVELTPRSYDRGRDVIATSTQGVAVRILDQVKKRAAHLAVTSDDVRSMLGVLSMHQNVSKVFVTTTSDFAPGVYRDPLIQQFVPYRLELRSRLSLLSWLSQARDILIGRRKMQP